MLSLEALGLLGLGIFWVSVVLLAADAGIVLRDLRGLGQTLRGVVRARVVCGGGEGGVLASVSFDQVGHALDDATPAIDVSHGRMETTVFGGRLVQDTEPTESSHSIEIALGAPMRVFLEQAAFERVGGPAPADFDAAFARAASPRGYVRPLRLTVGEGDEVFYAPGDARGGVISTLDPRRWLARKSGLVATYGALHLLSAAMVTSVAVAWPMDTWIAKLGGLLCLAHFLASAPLLRAVKLAASAPDEVRRYWKWVAPRAGASNAASTAASMSAGA